MHNLGADFFKVHPMGANAPIAEIEPNILPAARAMLDDLDWWTRATMGARAETAREAA